MKVFIATVLAIFQVTYCDWNLEPKEVNYIYKRTECHHFNPKFIDKLNCSHTFPSRSRKYSYFEFTIHPGVKIDQIFFDLSSYKKFGTVFRPTLIKLKENFCDIVSNKSNSYFAKEYRKLFGTFITNLNEPCPLQGKKYKRDNVDSKETGESMGYRPLPPLIPIGDWKFVYKFTTLMNGPEELFLQIADVYEVTQKTATQF